MYNRYLPQDDFAPVEPPEQARQEPPKSRGGLLGGLLDGFKGSLPKADGILKALHLDRFDKGDILLILVLVYLFIESDDEDWLIVLALVLLMGL